MSGKWRRSPATWALSRSRSSHEVSPLIKLVGRGDTTVVDAYLSPILRRYVASVAHELGDNWAWHSGSLVPRWAGPALPPQPSPHGGGNHGALSKQPLRRGGCSVAADAVRLMFMMSSGGLTAAHLFQGKDAILSGPAGGVVGMAETGREAGFVA